MDFDWKGQTPQPPNRRRGGAARGKTLAWTLLLGVSLIASVAWLLVELAKSKHKAEDAQAAQEPAPPTITAEPPQSLPPNFRAQPPPEQPTPEGVHQFLEAEQSYNSARAATLVETYGAPMEESFSVRFCRPVWDYREATQKVLWFYAYESAKLQEQSLIVFGVVEPNGQPLFQHPPMAGDPMAMLESQYQALQWVQCEQPLAAFVAAINGPWPGAAATVDLFGLAGDDLGRTWRLADVAQPEDTLAGEDEIIALFDATSDGFRDWCAYRPGPPGTQALARVLSFGGDGRSYAAHWQPLEGPPLVKLAELHQQNKAGQSPPLTVLRRGRLPLPMVSTAPALEKTGSSGVLVGGLGF